MGTKEYEGKATIIGAAICIYLMSDLYEELSSLLKTSVLSFQYLGVKKTHIFFGLYLQMMRNCKKFQCFQYFSLTDSCIGGEEKE